MLETPDAIFPILITANFPQGMDHFPSTRHPRPPPAFFAIRPNPLFSLQIYFGFANHLTPQ